MKFDVEIRGGTKVPNTQFGILALCKGMLECMLLCIAHGKEMGPKCGDYYNQCKEPLLLLFQRSGDIHRARLF